MSSEPIRKALYQRLTGDATLVALLASPTAVYDEDAPQGSPRPYVVISRPSHLKVGRSFDGDAVDNDVWQIKAIDGTRPDKTEPSATRAEQIDARIALLLDGHKLSVAGRHTLAVLYESGIRYREPDGQTGIWHIGGLYRIQTSD